MAFDRNDAPRITNLIKWCREALHPTDREGKAHKFSVIHVKGHTQGLGDDEVQSVSLEAGISRTPEDIVRALYGSAKDYSEDLVGVQAFSIIAHYKTKDGTGDEKPKVRPFTIEVAAPATGLYTEAPDDRGQTMQKMRHGEMIVQQSFRRAEQLDMQYAQLLTIAMTINSNLQTQNHDLVDQNTRQFVELRMVDDEREERRQKQALMGKLLQVGVGVVLPTLMKKFGVSPDTVAGLLPDESSGDGAEEEEGSAMENARMDDEESGPNTSRQARPESTIRPPPPSPAPADRGGPPAFSDPVTAAATPAARKAGTVYVHPDTALLRQLASVLTIEDHADLADLADLDPSTMGPLVVRLATLNAPRALVNGKHPDAILLDKVARGVMAHQDALFPKLQSILGRHQEMLAPLTMRFTALDSEEGEIS